jgi:hypothetical protein
VTILSYLSGHCPRAKKLKSCQRKFGTFAFAQLAKANPQGKSKRAKSPARHFDDNRDFIN